jgi:hypothetical protein
VVYPGNRPERGTACEDREPCRPTLPDSGSGYRMVSRQEPIPILAIAERLGGRSPRRPRPWWSRPMPTDGCSVVARMPRYAPAVSGIRNAPRIPATGQNDSSRHVLASLDTKSGSRIELSSGLLIRGFGVQVPGGAPVLTRGFTAPGHFSCVRFVRLCAPRVLGGREHGAGQLVKNGSAGLGQP